MIMADFFHPPANESLRQFRIAINDAGLVPPEDIIVDGKLHRFASNGKFSDSAGWYVLFDDGVMAGSFGCWRAGIKQFWRGAESRRLTTLERQRHKEARRADIDAHKARQLATAEKAAILLARASPCVSHPYLVTKSIQPHGSKQYKSCLLVPMHDAGGLCSLQLIQADGTKRYLQGGRTHGCYFVIGDIAPGDIILVAEGFATGGTLREATGHAVVVAFTANNLQAVADEFRRRYPDHQILICGDDDFKTSGNPGVTKATAAARTARASLVLPIFDAERPATATDFNDMATLYGVGAVKKRIDQAAAGSAIHDQLAYGGVAGVPSVPTTGQLAPCATPLASAGVPEVVDAAPPDDSERPLFATFCAPVTSENGRRYRAGVWHFGFNRHGDPMDTWICGPLWIEAVTHDGKDNSFGRLLRFQNTLGRSRTWSMPMDLLSGNGELLRAELLAMGLDIAPEDHARRKLVAYLLSSPPQREMRCVHQVGWCDDAYVLPDSVIGPNKVQAIFQSGERHQNEFGQAGTLDGWRIEIASKAEGNPLLVLAISVAFVGPLLKPCHAGGGGINLVGESSTGKTTALEVGRSVWGGAEFRRSWKATANGMEGAAALHNDCLLVLDEISECDPKEVGNIIYALGNGHGKQRAGRSGQARPVSRFRCFVLSTGERTIATTMGEAGQRAKAGQLVRMIDVPASRKFGAWDDLHEHPTGTAFSDALKRAASHHYGVVGRAFIEKLADDISDLCAMYEEYKALPQFQDLSGDSQRQRVGAHFAMVAMAGELATGFGLTGWMPGFATQAAAEFFEAWCETHGPGNNERRQVLESLTTFISLHGDSRFSDAEAEHTIVVRERAGWWIDTPDGRDYLLSSAGMHAALKGLDFKPALQLLQDAGVLKAPGTNGKRSDVVRIRADKKQERVYRVKSSKLEANHDE